jgi:hypothetical protein
MEPAVTALLQGRLRSAPFRPLLLLVHGRAQREIPAELRSLAADLPTLEHPLGLVPLCCCPVNTCATISTFCAGASSSPSKQGAAIAPAARLTAASSQWSMQAGRAQFGSV